MLQLENNTPFVSTLNLIPDAKGVDTLYVVIKATFTLGNELALAETQQPLHMADDFFAEPGLSSLKYSSDIHLAKQATDVALVGSAHTPGHRSQEQLGTSLSVGSLAKTIYVVGEQEWTGRLLGPSKGPIKPFNTMPLTYERAFGGVHVINEKKGKFKAVESNPVGQGFRAGKRRKDLKGRLAPCLVDPQDSERPACYGFVAPTWHPRVGFAGTYDEAWERQRSPYLPQDFDARFFNAAHPDLIANGFLQGGESVKLKNLSPQGTLRFPLPCCKFDLAIKVGQQMESPTLNLETVLFEPDDARMTMLWRAALSCDKKALKVELVEVGLQEFLLNGRPV